MKLLSRLRTMTMSAEARDALVPMFEAKRSTIADLVENEVASVAGTVITSDEILLAPLSKRPCVMWYVHVEGSDFISNTRASVPFVIEEDGRRAVIDARDARVVLKPTFGAESRMANPEHVRVLDQVGASLHDGPFHMMEAVVVLGQRIAVVGSGILDRDPRLTSDDYRTDAATLIRMGGKIGLTDHPPLARKRR